MRVGLIGLGQIGRGAAELLVEAGHGVVGYDVAAEANERAAGTVTLAGSPAAVAEASEIVLLAVYDDRQVRDTLAAVLGASDPPRAVVILATVTLECVRWAGEAAAARSVGLLDCGVTRGGHWEGPRKTYVCMVGGDERTFAGCREVLDAIGDPVLHMGGLGSGMKTKVVRNMMMYGFHTVAWEGARLAVASGLDLDAFIAAARACDRQGAGPYGPLGRGIGLPDPSARDLEQGRRLLGFGRKDLAAALALGEETGTDTPVVRTIDALFAAVTGLETAVTAPEG